MNELRRCEWVFIEGYMLEHDDAHETLRCICELARRWDVKVALSAGDASRVRSSRGAFDEFLPYVDLLFANKAEARCLLSDAKKAGAKDVESLATSLTDLAPVAVVTDGYRGSCLATRAEQRLIRIHAEGAEVRDTCGAGDAYAAGFLF